VGEHGSLRMKKETRPTRGVGESQYYFNIYIILNILKSSNNLQHYPSGHSKLGHLREAIWRVGESQSQPHAVSCNQWLDLELINLIID